MKRILCMLLCLGLLSGCTAPNTYQPAPEETPPPAAEQPEKTGVSCVEQLALDIVTAQGLSASQGEMAVRALYHYLIEQVYFADPVGLDLWRYMSEYDQIPISYLENRAFSPLQFNIGSCEDFAAAMVLLLRAAGFEAEYVPGFTLSVNQVYIDHAWAVVKLEDCWYHIDPQLEQNVIRDSMLTYRYYLKSDNDFAIDHKWGENLITYWPDIPRAEKTAIRASAPPACPETREAPAPVQTALPAHPDSIALEAEFRRIKEQSGKGELSPIWLDVEPPVLVSQHHITPPLLEQHYSPSLFCYGRSLMVGEAAELYDRLLDFAGSMEEGATLDAGSSLSDTELQLVAETFLTEHPELYWAEITVTRTGQKRQLMLHLRLSPEEILDQRAQIDAKVEEILTPLKGSSPFYRALAIHDILAAVPYDKGETGRYSDNLYGVLVEGTATCYGYAGGFQYLAQQAGLDCVLLTGHSQRGIGHAWNAVRIDGSWHFVDVTWDRPLQDEDTVYHDFFLMTTEEMQLERRWDTDQYPVLPEPGVGFADYYRRMEYSVSGPVTAEATAEVARLLYRQLAAKQGLTADPRMVFLELKVEGSPQAYGAWKEWFVKSIFDVQRQVQVLAEADGGFIRLMDMSTAKCDFNDTMQVITFYPTATEEETQHE